MNEHTKSEAAERAATAPAECPVPRWGRWAAMGAFVFFLLKGLAWLVVPAALAWWAS